MVRRVDMYDGAFSKVNNPERGKKGKEGLVKHADSTWLGRTIQVKTLYCKETLHLNRGSLINYINSRLGEHEPKLKKSWLGLGLWGGASNNEIQDKLNDTLAQYNVDLLEYGDTSINIENYAKAMKRNIEAYIQNLEATYQTGTIQWEIISSKKDGNSLQLQLIFPDEETKKRL